MPIRNTREEFGAVHKTLHWTVAGLVLAAYVTICITNSLVRRSPEWRGMLHVHQLVGWAVLFVALGLTVWRLANPRPHVDHASRFEEVSARGAHFLLYVFLITMPLSGYLGGDRPRDYFGLFVVPSFRTSDLFLWISATFGVTFEEFEKPLDYFHTRIVGDWLLWMIIALHVAAALFHHIHRRDLTLVRMLPRPIARMVTPRPRQP